MAAIHFESDVDNSKLNKGFKESEQTVEDFVKKVEKSGGVIGDFAAQSAKQMKESITIQKNAINELKQQIKELENATKSGGGSYKENLAAQGKLAAAKKNLVGEEAALIAMQKQQTASNAVQAESQIPIIGGLWKWAAGLATVTAAMKIGKAIIASTDDTADKFAEVIAASTSAVQYFFKAIASGDWSNFLDGMSDAMKGAVEFERSMERINDLKNEQLIKSAESRTKIGELRAATFETTDPKELKKLLGELIKEQESNFKKEQNLRKLEKEAVLDKAATDSGVSKEKIQQFIKEYSSLEKMYELGKKYNELPKTTVFKQGEITLGERRPNQSSVDALGAGAEEAGKYAAQIGKITDETKKLLSESIAAEENAKAAFDNSNRRDKEKLKNIEKQAKEESIAAAKKAKEDAELENRIKATQEAMKAASGEKLRDLAAGLVLLEKELALRTEIVKQANQSAWTNQFKGQSMTPMTSIGTKQISSVGALKITDGVLYELTAIDKKGRETFTKVKTENKELFKNATELAKKADKDQEELDKDNLDRKTKITQEIISRAEQFTAQLIEQLDLGEAQTKQLLGLTSIVSNLAKGDYVAAAFSFLTMVTDGLIKKKRLFNEYYDEVNQKITDLLDSISLVNSTFANIGEGGSVGAFNVLSSELVGLKNDADRLATSLNTVTSAGRDAGGRRRGSGTDTGTTGTRDEEVTEKERTRNIVSLITQAESLRKQIIVLSDKLLDPLLSSAQQTAIKDILNGYNNILSEIDNVVAGITGTTYSELSNALADAFLSGEDAAVKWGEKVNDVINNIIKNKLIAELLSKPITQAINTLVEDQADSLTPEEAKKFKDTIDAIYADVAPAFQTAIDALKLSGIDLIGSTTKESTSLTGQIKGVSEDTASMIAGRLMAVNTDMKKGLEIGYDTMDIMNTGVGHLLKIERNTYDTVQQIIVTNSKLDTVISNQAKYG